MKLEICKFYRTRLGDKAEVLCKSDSIGYLRIRVTRPKIVKQYSYKVDGEHPIYSHLDLVGPWEELATTLKVGQTYKTRAGYLAEVLHISFKGPNPTLSILALVHLPTVDLVHHYTAQGTKPNQPALDLVKLVTADNPAKGMSLRNLQHALHMMKKSQSDKLNHEFKDYYPGIITKDQVKAELETRCSITYLPLKKISSMLLKTALDSSHLGHMSFLSDNSLEVSDIACWRAYNRTQLQDELERRLEA